MVSTINIHAVLDCLQTLFIYLFIYPFCVCLFVLLVMGLSCCHLDLPVHVTRVLLILRSHYFMQMYRALHIVNNTVDVITINLIISSILSWPWLTEN